MLKIQILGTGCPKCRRLAENAESAVRELGIDGRVEKVTDPGRIVQFGVMLTPALAVDGRVKAAGKVLTTEQIKKILIFCSIN